MKVHEPSKRIAETLRREVEDLLGSVGFLCRVFARGKSDQSLIRKLNAEPGKYSPSGRLVQDVIGLRVVLYFPEDIPIVQEILCGKYRHDALSSTIDVPRASVFSVTRHNLIFKLPADCEREFLSATQGNAIDSTFEVQIRSILSEGWHEVEHDLRYKRSSHWVGHDDLSRGLNGLVATLETAEWSMRKILDDLAHRQYRAGRWEAMLHSAVRMRVAPGLATGIIAEFDHDNDLAKEMFRINRNRMFRSLVGLAPKIPVTLDNLVYLWNHIEVGNRVIAAMTPRFLLDTFSAAQLPNRAN